LTSAVAPVLSILWVLELQKSSILGTFGLLSVSAIVIAIYNGFFKVNI
jgi:hypothetical protein